ncbi:hypothetical protein [Mesorhizobium xinjiangense]|uniref:hypothetical protein n=1 Tax=Mesorhizobium xinjiangense TaxID=2678685 RepID=UPI0012ED5158|nr:hypothetical protein [Mesorhizobium xinjiangense]
MIRGTIGSLALALCAVAAAAAGEADVVAVEVTPEPGGTFRFDVTVRHSDEGWDHYADRWDLVGADGAVYGERVLLHPHVDEQPFTRSQGGIEIPDGVDTVTVRAHDKVHGLGGKELDVALPER